MKNTMKITILTLVLMFTANIVFAQVPLTPSTGCVSGNCVNGKGKMVYDNGNMYEGDFVTGEKDGQGTYTYKDGGYYTGAWKNNLENGYGKKYSKSGNIVREGTWKDGFFVDSNGDLVFFDVNDIDLDKFKDIELSKPKCVSGNCVNGQGKYWSSDETYEGDWVNGKYDGKGKLTVKTFDQIFEGDFVKGQFTGKGIHKIDVFGYTYEGNFVNGKLSGKGKLIMKDVKTYEGDWVNGELEGQVTEKSETGDYYIGEYKSFKRNGYGKEYTKSTDTIREGTWKDDVFVGSNAVKDNSSSKDKEAAIEANIVAKLNEVSLKLDSSNKKKINIEKLELAKQALKLQKELVQYLTDVINGTEVSETAKSDYRKLLELEKLTILEIEDLIKTTTEAAKLEPK